MRRWFVLLMVVLLPLRAAVGDVLSLGMALAAKPASVSAGMSPDCPMHLASGGADPATEEGAPAPSGAECGSCALCFPVAQAEALAAVGPLPVAEARPALGDGRFASAVVRGLLRPPRS